MMKRVIPFALIAVMLLLLLVLVPSANVVAEIVEIPLDAKTGIAPQEDGYVAHWQYEDPSLSIVITKDRIYDTDYVVARVKLANASQLRTAMAEGYKSQGTALGTSIAKRVKSTLAINGDYFSSRSGQGFVARQGVVYRTQCKGDFDVLIIDDKGDLHILPKAQNADIEAFEGTIIQGFTFGPGLVIDGVRQTGFEDMHNAAFKAAQRMCIAQVGELEYLCICAEGPEDKGSKGLVLEQFAELVASFGVQNAYNLDGGSSATMVFQGDKINSPNNPKRRPLCDMLYFSSAYVPDEPAGE